jgi:hypothetical protein
MAGLSRVKAGTDIGQMSAEHAPLKPFISKHLFGVVAGLVPAIHVSHLAMAVG